MTFKRRALLLLSLIGPGLITANIDNDAGGITTYSIAGAHYGYTLLWTIIPITLALMVIQEMSSRMGVVTGKGLAELIREEYGVKITFWLMIFLLLTNLGNTASEFAGWAASMELFGISKYVSVPVGALFVWLIVVKGTYQAFEKLFLVCCVVYFVYIPSAIMAKPDWSEVALQTIKPHVSFDTGYLVTIIGIVGTTIAPWMQFYQQAAIVEKGLRKEHYWATKIDVVVGCVMMAVVAYFIIVACGATLHKSGIKIESAEQVAVSLAPVAGKYASWLFAIGLANASLFAASILPLSTAYFICEGMGWESGISKNFSDAPQFMWLYTLIIATGALVILIPGSPLIRIMWISQVINGMLLPFVLIFMVLLINKKELMEEYTNSRFFNIITWTTVIIMILMTLGFAVSLFF